MPPPNPTVKRKDPFPTFCFKVVFHDLKGIDDAYFKSVSGLRSETEVIPVRAGGTNNRGFNLVGAVKWSPIVLKQGFASTALLAWRRAWTLLGANDPPPPPGAIRTDLSIIQLDTALKGGPTWTFEKAWPSKWELGEFDASKSELQIETLELVHEHMSHTEFALE